MALKRNYPGPDIGLPGSVAQHHPPSCAFRGSKTEGVGEAQITISKEDQSRIRQPPARSPFPKSRRERKIGRNDKEERKRKGKFSDGTDIFHSDGKTGK